jgi:glutamate carboxypeptidase
MLDFNVYLPAMLTLLRRLVETESPSQDKLAVDNVGAIIIDKINTMDGKIELIINESSGNHIIARFDPPLQAKLFNNEPGFLILCHMDTVFPCGSLLQMPYVEKEGRIHGPGVCDMKAGMVIAMTVVQALHEIGKMPPHPVTILFTSDEESGSQTSRRLIEDLSRKAKLVLVLEPGLPDGSLKTWRKGVGEFHILARGQAAHSGGDHEKGRNAIEEISHQVQTIQRMTDYGLGTTLNVGVIQGGMAVNVVPDKAWMDVDLRVIQPGEAERISTLIHQLKPVLAGTALEISGGINRPPMPYNELMQSTFEHACLVAAREGIQLSGAGTGGASDGNFVAELGIPILDGLGAIGGDYHSEKEYILKDSLVSRARLLATLLQNW